MAYNKGAIAEIQALLMAATEEAVSETVLSLAQEYIPVKDGVAKDSGQVVRDGDTVYVSFGRDDDGSASHMPSNDYIIPLHEDVEAVHDSGQAKFLERAMNEASGYLPDNIAGKVKI